MDASIRSNVAPSRRSSTVVGRFHCQEALEGAPPFVVHRARTQGLAGLERLCALKTLPPEAEGTRPDAAKRLLDAASQAGSLRDARVAQVMDVGRTSEGFTYVATELLQGVDFGRLRGALLPQARGEGATNLVLLAHLGAELAAALAVAHDAKPRLVHGNVCASNAFVTTKGAVKVVDFGHRLAVVPSRATGAKRWLPAHAAPELLLGGEGSAEADVYALASLLFEVATGKTGPSARNPRSATDLSRALSVLSPPLCELLLACLKVDPSKRPAAREAEAGFRALALPLSEGDLRALLAAQVRRLVDPAPEPAESAVLPTLAPDPEPAAPAQPPAPRRNQVAPQNTIAFARLFDGTALGPVPEEPMHTGATKEMPASSADVAASAGQLPAVRDPDAPGVVDPAREGSAAVELSMTDLEPIGSGDDEPTVGGPNMPFRQEGRAVARTRPPAVVRVQPEAALPVAGGAGPLLRPEMDNLTTGEMDALFAPGLAESRPTPRPAAPLAATGGVTDGGDDFLEDAKTNAFDGRGVRALLSDAETPVRRPPPMGLVFPPASEPVSQEPAASPPWLENEGPFEAAAASGDGFRESRGVEVPQLLDDSDAAFGSADGTPFEEELQGFARVSHRRRFVITVATAAIVAVAGGVAGGFFLGQPAGLPPRAERPPSVAPEDPMPPAQPVEAAPAPAPAVAEAAPPPAPPEPVPAAPVAVPQAQAEPLRAAAPAPRDARGRALVLMKSEPEGAAIWINGGLRGHTPTQVELKDRHRRLVIVKEGHERLEQTLPEDGLTAEMHFRLAPVSSVLEGSATVDVTCEKQGQYPIAIDGRETGLLCPAAVTLPAGAHEISVYVPWRFKSYSAPVSLADGERKSVSFAK